MSRHDDKFEDQMANLTCGVILWIITAGIGGLISLIQWDQWKQRERYPDGKPIGQHAEQQRLGMVLVGCVVVVIGLVLSYQGMMYGAYPRTYGAAAPTFISGLVFLIGGLGLVYSAWTRRLWKAEVLTLQPLPLENARAYCIRVPHSTAWNGEAALHLMSELVTAMTPIVFRLYADENRLEWQIIDVVGANTSSLIESILRAAFPNAEILVNPLPQETLRQPTFRFLATYRQHNMFPAPLQYVTDLKTVDPLSTLANVLTALEAGESVVYTLLVHSVAREAYEQGERLITQSAIHPLQWLSRVGVGDAIGKMITKTDRIEKYVPHDQRVFEDKLREKLYHAYLVLQVDAPQPQRLHDLLILADTQLGAFTRMPYNALSWVESPIEQQAAWLETAEDAAKTNDLSLLNGVISGLPVSSSVLPTLVLEPRELAALWHLPHEGMSASRIIWSQGQVFVSHAASQVSEGIHLGIGTQEGREILVRLSPQDRAHHINIVGKTGTGKSTFLHHLIHQDIVNGAGIAVIDPLGHLVNRLLEVSIPDERIGDVVLLDLANTAFPPPLNPLHSAKGYTSTLRVVNLIERLFAGTEHAARMASYLRAALIPLQQQAHPTMRDMARLFRDEVYREELLQATDDPETQDFWDFQYNHASPAMQRQIAEPILNRIRPFFANPTLYPCFCHPDALDFRTLMDENKIILISLGLDEEHLPPQERSLVGALLVSQLHMAAAGRSAAKPYYLYIDEVQEFVTTSLPDMFSQARNVGLSLVTANQFLGQLTGKLLDAVMGNVGTTLVFQCSPDDAQVLAAYTKPDLTAHDLINLSRFQAAVKMNVNGKPQPAFHLKTLKPFKLPAQGQLRGASIRQQSIQTYTPKSREVILAWLRERYPRTSANRSTPISDEATFYE